ncbi:MAG TPA: CRTAC1 family protein, partial [Chthonomonadales bacterium]|nr:CRTAC1 family protein [Chthonomonadales bacterium]
LTVLCGAILCSAGCNHSSAPAIRISKAADTRPFVTFTDVTRSAGIDFQHINGAFGKKWLPETMGSGVAWIDYDGDGYQDLFLVNSRNWTDAELKSAGLPPSGKYDPRQTCKLYHNNGDGTFTDVTKKAHLDVPMYGMGVCVGDYDNDGHPDLYVTALGHNYLFHNSGDGTFTDVTAKAGVGSSGWSTSAAWVDYDKDGKLDLIVCHYVPWTPATDIPCPRNGHNTYCTPQQYAGQPLTLYHNEGNGRFKDVSVQAGLRKSADGRTLQGKSLGVAICDYDGDGWPDIVVANDTEPNYLFHNEKNGTFKEVGVEEGIAYPDTGQARGAMGIDACDYDRNGRDSIVIGNFSNQMLSVYHNEGSIFRDVASQAGVGPPSLLSLSFGLCFADFDNDGWPDLFVANGHVDDDIGEIQKEVTYAERPLLFRNEGNGSFQNVSEQCGQPLTRKMVARGVAYADYDLRGVLDLAVTTNNGPAYLLRNSGNGNHSFRLELEGTKSNRSAIGASVQVKVGSGVQYYDVRSGSSYCSQSELPITVGLGQETQADSVAIHWPSDEVTTLNNVAAGSIYHVVEGKGIVRSRPFGRPVRLAH